MKCILPVCVLASLSICCAHHWPARAQAAEEPAAVAPAAPAAPDDAGRAGMEVMTRGPIHEAFAQPVNSGAVTSLVVGKKPPEPIEELPPDAKPADENAVWIGGYWNWDDERKDFLWVSGVWRVPPPGSRWISGYWAESSGSYQWVPGFWSPVASQEVEYFPEPPASLEQGPSSDPPSVDHIWIAGCWQWHDLHYVWQPGYWGAAQPGWVWVPASYYWCPRGWVFSSGYWDYPLARRGLIFAPVYFPAALYMRPGFVYAPAVVIDPGLLTFYLFVRPTYCHYYFGDYFAAHYDGLGIYPWFAIRAHRDFVYDPLFTYYRWHYSSRDPHWVENLQGWHHYYRAHPDQRPPHDLAAQRQIAAKAGDRADRKFLMVAGTLADWRQKPNPTLQLTAVAADQKAKILESTRKVQAFKTSRLQLETKGLASGTPGTAAGAAATNLAPLKTPQKLRLPESVGTLGLQSPVGERIKGGKSITSGAGAMKGVTGGVIGGAQAGGSDASAGTRKLDGSAGTKKLDAKGQFEVSPGGGPGTVRGGGTGRYTPGPPPQTGTLRGGTLPGGQQLRLPPPPSGSTGGGFTDQLKQGPPPKPSRTENAPSGPVRGRSDTPARDRSDRKDTRDKSSDR